MSAIFALHFFVFTFYSNFFVLLSKRNCRQKLCNKNVAKKLRRSENKNGTKRASTVVASAALWWRAGSGEGGVCRHAAAAARMIDDNCGGWLAAQLLLLLLQLFLYHIHIHMYLYASVRRGVWVLFVCSFTFKCFQGQFILLHRWSFTYWHLGCAHPRARTGVLLLLLLYI